MSPGEGCWGVSDGDDDVVEGNGSEDEGDGASRGGSVESERW